MIQNETRLFFLPLLFSVLLEKLAQGLLRTTVFCNVCQFLCPKTTHDLYLQTACISKRAVAVRALQSAVLAFEVLNTFLVTLLLVMKRNLVLTGRISGTRSTKPPAFPELLLLFFANPTVCDHRKIICSSDCLWEERRIAKNRSQKQNWALKTFRKA